MSDTILITGYGYTGSRLVSRLTSAGANVRVMVRRADQAEAARAAGVDAVLADLDDAATLGAADIGGSTLVHLAPPPKSGDRDTRLRNLLASLQANPPVRIVLISTTGVYGDRGGAVVDEATPCNPTTERAVRRVDAENAATEFAKANETPLIILRVPGIYGPGRLPLERLRAQAPLPPAVDCGTSNRIHVEDLVTAIVAASTSSVELAVFNISDGHPLNMRTWRETVADLAGLPRPPEISLEQAREELSPMTLSFLNESRQIDSSAIRVALNLELEFQDPVAGIRNSLESEA